MGGYRQSSLINSLSSSSVLTAKRRDHSNNDKDSSLHFSDGNDLIYQSKSNLATKKVPSYDLLLHQNVLNTTNQQIRPEIKEEVKQDRLRRSVSEQKHMHDGDQSIKHFLLSELNTSIEKINRED